MMATKRKHSDYSLDMKRKIVTDIHKGIKNRVQVINELSVSKSTLATWIKNADKINKDADRCIFVCMNVCMYIFQHV